jgi:TM2 domain-containing membrane protein YozV
MLLKTNITAVIFFLFFFCFQLWSEQTVTDEDKVYAFAEWLYEQGEYTRAAGEYLRFLFLSHNKDHSSIMFKIGLCYKNAEDYRRAITAFQKALDLTVDDTQKEAVYYELAFCFFKLELYHDSLSVVLGTYGAGQVKSPRMLLLETADNLCLTEWETAFLLSDAYLKEDQNPYRELAFELNEFAQDGQTLPYKSPVAAGILSAVIPGSGKIYAGHFMDGVFSLVTVGIFGGMAAYSFYEEGVGSVRGWIYTAVGGIFYAGNIYGSVTAAHLSNNEQEQRIIREVRETVDNKFP